MKTAKPILLRSAQWTRRAPPLATMALAGTMILSLAATATAETGTFRMTQVELHAYTSFDFAGQTITGGALEGTGTVLDSSGGRAQPRDLHGLREAK